jgi:outer membrane murein-binding lipoprotein Lpp
MKSISRFVLAAIAVGTCAVAGAQPYGPADQERRDRNREEAIARHERMEQRSSVRENAREGADTVKAKTRRAAHKTESFTHRQLNKVRNFGERQQSKFGPTPAHPNERGTLPTGEKPVAPPPK